MWIPPGPLGLYPSDKWSQNWYTGCNVPNIDFEDAGKGGRDRSPGEVFGRDVVRNSRARDGDQAGYDSEAHKKAKGYLRAGRDAEVAEKDDREGGADEVCQEGGDYRYSKRLVCSTPQTLWPAWKVKGDYGALTSLSDENVPHGLQWKTFSGSAEIPHFVKGSAL